MNARYIERGNTSKSLKEEIRGTTSAVFLKKIATTASCDSWDRAKWNYLHLPAKVLISQEIPASPYSNARCHRN